jgi:hypothetical protein
VREYQNEVEVLGNAGEALSWNA